MGPLLNLPVKVIRRIRSSYLRAKPGVYHPWNACHHAHFTSWRRGLEYRANYTITWSYDNRTHTMPCLNTPPIMARHGIIFIMSIMKAPQEVTSGTTPGSQFGPMPFQDQRLQPAIRQRHTSGTFSSWPSLSHPFVCHFESTTNHNVIVWGKSRFRTWWSIHCYKESNEAGVTKIGNVGYNSPSVITDTNSNPAHEIIPLQTSDSPMH